MTNNHFYKKQRSSKKTSAIKISIWVIVHKQWVVHQAIEYKISRINSKTASRKIVSYHQRSLAQHHLIYKKIHMFLWHPHLKTYKIYLNTMLKAKLIALLKKKIRQWSLIVAFWILIIRIIEWLTFSIELMNPGSKSMKNFEDLNILPFTL